MTNGLSYEAGRQLMHLADAVEDRIRRSRNPEIKQAARIIADPPESWTHEDYEGLNEIMRGLFGAETLADLMRHLNLPFIRLPEKPSGGGGGGGGGNGDPEKRLVQTWLFGPYFELVKVRKDRAKWEQGLWNLDLRSSDPAESIGLIEMEEELAAQLAVVRDVRERKQRELG